MSTKAYLAHNRFGLGWRPDAAVLPADPVPVLRGQLGTFDPAPPAIAALPTRGALVTQLATYREAVRTAKAAPPMSRDADVEARDLRAAYLQAAAVRIEQAASTAQDFPERLVHFWSNHFAVSVQALPVAMLAGDYEHRAIRPHIMGRFGDLLRAAVLHPAMLLYLDQAQSIGPGSALAARAGRRAARNPDAEGRKIGLNENLAREILELHTLGVRTVYTQADVTAFARAMTGWTVAGIGQRADRLLGRGVSVDPGTSIFSDLIHEPGAQTIVGRRFAEDGEAQSLAVLDMLAVHPATARHVATKLARHFAADTPPPALVARLEADFLRTGGDLKSLYIVLLTAPEVWTADAPKFKTPWDWTIGAVRALGMKRLPDRRGGVGVFEQLGQPIWRPGAPAGYDDIAASWAGPSGLMLRAEVAHRIAGTAAAPANPRDWAAAMLVGAGSAATLTAIARADSPAQGTALALMSPEFLRR